MSGITATSTLITANALPPIDRAFAKRHLRSIGDAEDDLVDSWIMAAAQYFEEQSGRSIMRTTWEYWIAGVPIQGRIELPHPPLVEVLTVETLDTAGAYTSFTDGASPETEQWQAQAPAGLYAPRGWIEPLAGTLWPSAWGSPEGIRIRYTAGYAETSAEVPEMIKAILLKLVGSFDQFRSETHFSEGARVERLPFGVDQMISAFKYNALPSQVLTRL